MLRNTVRTALLALAIVTPASAATPADRGADIVTDAHFAASFSRFETLPEANRTPPGAVALDSFDPPVEVKPATRSIGSGVASFYGKTFQGRRTASGEAFDMNAYTAAHRTLPFGTMVAVTNPRTGRSVTVRINDRGPFHGNRVIDVSRAAATDLGLIQRGSGAVELALVD